MPPGRAVDGLETSWLNSENPLVPVGVVQRGVGRELGGRAELLTLPTALWEKGPVMAG